MRPTIESAPPSHAGPWRYEKDEETGCVHVMPMFGPRHAFFPPCWCNPISDPSEHMMLHNVAQ